MKILTSLVVLGAAFALIAAGCGGGSSSAMPKSGVAGATHTASTVMVKTRKLSGYGTVLVNAQGHTLYMFAKDARRHVTCTGSCASFWPPLKQKGSQMAAVGGSAKASLIGSDKDPAGGRVVTYSRYPLYAYVGDHGAGQSNGEGLNVSGGLWYMLSPSGKVIKSKTAGGGGGGTTTSSWG